MNSSVRPPTQISIVIPTYNRSELLKKALLSLQRQSLLNWDAVVVNNFSEDDTEKVVAEMADPRILLFNFKNHGCIGASRNQGVQLTRSPYVCFLDADDFWYSNKLEKTLNAFNQGYDVVAHGMYLTDGRVKFRTFEPGSPSRLSAEGLLVNGNSLVTSAVSVRKSAIEKAGGWSDDPRMITAEDYDLWIRLSAQKARFYCMNEPLGEYLISESGESKRLAKHLSNTIYVVEKNSPLLGTDETQKRLVGYRKAFLKVEAIRNTFRSRNYKEGVQRLLELRADISFLPAIFKQVLWRRLGLIHK
jgi:glycosyltransferase involved in cell wall biosynthesis